MAAAAKSHDLGDNDRSCWDGVSEHSLARALAGSVTDCVEADVLNPDEPRAPGPASGRFLRLTVTAWSVYRLPIASTFLNALETRVALSPDLHERVLTSLQEALMNAMLHGNLGLESASCKTFQGLARAHETINACFASARTARSAIGVDAHWTRTMLRVTVRDRGRGFKWSEPALEASPISSGRGLGILEAMCDRVTVRDKGVTIELGFRLTATAA